MRIEKIDLKNYRQFREIEILFRKHLEKDLHVIIANNATGKTNLLNAINWCLYGREPHLSKGSQQLPRLNLNTLVEAEDGSKETVVVELLTEAEGNRITFKRTEDYVIHKDSGQPTLRDTSFQVTFVDERKNAKMVTDEEAKSYVERFVPHDIREFFFFDGERLDTYFKSATGVQISHAIFQISQVDTLDRMADRMENVVSDLKKDAGKRNPQLEEKREILEAKQKTQKEIVNQIAECNRQKEEAREQLVELNERLRSIPDIGELQKEQEKLNENKKNKEKISDEKIKDKRNLLFENGIILKLYPSLERAARIIQVKVENREIPQTYDTRLLDNIMKTHLCICGREIREKSDEEERIDSVRKEIKVSSDIAQELIGMQSPLNYMRAKVSQFKASLEKITSEIQIYDEDLKVIVERLQKIEFDIVGYNVEQVKQWYEELKTYQEISDYNVEKIINLRLQKEKQDREIETAKEDENKELRRLSLLKELRQSIDFGSIALDVVREVKDTMMSRIRVQIERETKELFFALIWKKETYRDVSIDESYSLHLIHSLGYECLGSVSASERQLLALSFVLALHKVSGFDSPIIVDTPVARVSNEQRENLGKVFSQVGSEKQLILLFLPTEYSTEISKTLDHNASSMGNLKLSEDEREVRMEVLR